MRVDRAGCATPNTKLISIMMATRTGRVQPVEQIGKIAAEAEVAFHTDSVQARGDHIDVKASGCHLLRSRAPTTPPRRASHPLRSSRDSLEPLVSWEPTAPARPARKKFPASSASA